MGPLRVGMGSVVALALGLVHAWAAPSGGLCPVPGTVVTNQVLGKTPFKVTMLGSDPADPLICVAKNQFGKTIKLFLHRYAVSEEKNPAVTRAAVGAFFSGQQQHVHFTRLSVLRDWPDRPRTSEDDWKWTGRGTVMLGGRAVPVWTGEWYSNGEAGARWRASATFAYDPQSRVILRWDFRETFPRIEELHNKVVAITPP